MWTGLVTWIRRASPAPAVHRPRRYRRTLSRGSHTPAPARTCSVRVAGRTLRCPPKSAETTRHFDHSFRCLGSGQAADPPQPILSAELVQRGEMLSVVGGIDAALDQRGTQRSVHGDRFERGTVAVNSLADPG